jgi:MerR family transcriptional regulator/heat shock protein HspR
VTKPVRRDRGDTQRPTSVPPPREWHERLADPDEPLYTVGVAADLIGVDAQTIRRLHVAALPTSARPSGNQRRYSRRDLEILAAAADLSREGISGSAIGRILALESEIRNREP